VQDRSERIEALVRTARLAAAEGLVVASSGNLSVRLDPDWFAISAAGAWLGELNPDRVALCSLVDPDRYHGPSPSAETRFHRALYLAREDVGAILHFQSPHATALACAEEPDLSLDVFPEVPAYLGRPVLVHYHAPGTAALADAVARAATRTPTRLLVLQSHGLIALGSDLRAALRNALFFELACKVTQLGVATRRLDPHVADDLRVHGYRTGESGR
jgi:ribulose-5-phosphate 4-epimerase/fuculose-1-phosphate aldolase